MTPQSTTSARAPSDTAAIELSFSTSEVRKWARFSYDYNPIHFDLQRAKSAGLDALVVHGMLALLPIKQAVTGAFHRSPGGHGGWLRFRALFRAPLAHDRRTRLTLRTTPTGVDFRLVAADSGMEHFRGGYAPADDPLATASEPWSEGGLAPDLMERRMLSFRDCYPGIDACWVALDAIVFSEFIRTKLDLVEAFALPYFDALAGDPKQRVMVQMSHTVFLDAARLGGDMRDAPSRARLCYRVASPTLVPGGDRLAGTIALTVTDDRQPLMLMELGLVVKAVPNVSRQ